MGTSFTSTRAPLQRCDQRSAGRADGSVLAQHSVPPERKRQRALGSLLQVSAGPPLGGLEYSRRRATGCFKWSSALLKWSSDGLLQVEQHAVAESLCGEDQSNMGALEQAMQHEHAESFCNALQTTQDSTCSSNSIELVSEGVEQWGVAQVMSFFRSGRRHDTPVPL